MIIYLYLFDQIHCKHSGEQLFDSVNKADSADTSSINSADSASKHSIDSANNVDQISK